MNKSPALPAVLIVDADLGFVGWLAELFNQAGYRALPALNCRQASALIRKFELRVDVIAIDEALPGASSLIGSLKGSRRPLKIVAIRNPDGGRVRGIAVHATLERPAGWEPISRTDWLKKIRGLLKQAQPKAV